MEDELIVTSKQGKVLRAKVSDIRVTGRNAAGVKIMEMRNEDKIIAVQPLAQAMDDEDETVPETQES